MRNLCFLRVWQCDYFGSTLRQIALCMIQFARAAFSEKRLCVEFSILVKMLHNIFGHNADCNFVFLFAACLPTVLNDLLRDKFLVSDTVWSSETASQETYTNFVLVLRPGFHVWGGGGRGKLSPPSKRSTLIITS